MFETKVDEESVFKGENVRPRLFTNMKVYAGGNFDRQIQEPILDGKIRNLIVETQLDEDEKKGDTNYDHDTNNILFKIKKCSLSQTYEPSQP